MLSKVYIENFLGMIRGVIARQHTVQHDLGSLVWLDLSITSVFSSHSNYWATRGREIGDVKEERAAEIGAGEIENNQYVRPKKKDGYGSRVFLFIG